MFTRSDLKELFTLTDDVGVGADLPEEGALSVDGKNPEYREKETFWHSKDQSGDKKRFRSKVALESVKPSSANSSSKRTVGDDDVRNHQEDVSAVEPRSRDQVLLRALWEGESISGVYDHSAVEPGDEYNRKEKSIRYEKFAERVVGTALMNLESSVTTRANSTESNSHYEYSNRYSQDTAYEARQSLNMVGRSSLDLLRGLSNHVGMLASGTNSSLQEARRSASNEVSSVSSSSRQRFTSTRITTPEACMLPKLLSILTPGVAISSEDLLKKFGALDDRFAVLFRETLRRIAKFENGKWSKKKS